MWQFVVIDLCYQVPAGIENRIEGSIRTSEERSLHKLSHSVVNEVDL